MTDGITNTPRFENYQAKLAKQHFNEEKRDNYRIECEKMDKGQLSVVFNTLNTKSTDKNENAYERTLAKEKAQIAKAVLALKDISAVRG